MGLFGFYFDRVWEVFKISRFGKMCYVWVPWQHFLPFFCSEGDSTSICSETSGRFCVATVGLPSLSIQADKSNPPVGNLGQMTKTLEGCLF